MAEVIIYGAGYLGTQILHHLQNYYPQVNVLGFTDDVREPNEEVVNGFTTVGSLEKAALDHATQPSSCALVFAIGYNNMIARAAALDHALKLGYKLFSVIHPQAMIEPNAHCGDGSVVLAGAILDQHVSVDSACFIDIGVRLGAGTVVGRNSYLSSGTSTGSRVQIGEDCFVGMDCTITTDVKVGSNVFINAKTLVARDTASDLKIVELHKSKNLPQPPSDNS